MSASAISPVLARIATIEARFGMASTAPAATQPSLDFAATLANASATTSAATSPGSTSQAPTATSLSTTYTGTTASTTTGWATGVEGNPAVGSSSLDPSSPYAAEFAAAGARYGVPAELLSAVGWVESRYRTDAVSSAGAIGMMQLMPFVATELGVDPNDPAQAVDGAARLLKSHYDRFGSWDLALAAYNAGAGAVKRAGDAIPSPGVAEYVRRVNERMQTA